MPRLGRFDRLDWLAITGAATGLVFVAFDAWILGLAVVATALVVSFRRTGRDGQTMRPHAVRADGGEPDIELVTAVIRPGKLNAVKQALAAAGAPSLTVTNVSGRGTQPTETGQWRGEEYIVDLHQKVKVEVVVRDEATDTVVEAITEAAHTGEPGDGKIWVLPVLDAVRVSTEERGPEAI